MAFESYNAQDIWSSGEAPGATSNLAAAGKLALAAGAGLGGFHMLMRPRGDGTRAIDQVAGFTRTAGNLTPFQLGNTFRVPEFLFPFTSPTYQKLKGGEHVFDKEFLGNPETTSYLQKITGKSYKELHALGLSQEAQLGADGASSLVYKAGRGARGSLHVNRGGVQTLLSNAVSLMSAESEIDPLKREAGLGINKAMRGVMQALDMWGQEGFNEKQFWANAKGERSGLIPVPSITGPMGSKGDLLRRSTYFRGISAFEVSRFNNLMGGYAQQIFGDTGAKFSQTVLGIGNEVRPGPASALLARYAGRAALLGGAALVVSQTDWIRRQGGLLGQAGAAGVTTGVGAYAAWKMGVNNKLVMMGSVASFFGQMTLPGFDQGLVQGAAATGAGLDIMRANPLNPFGYYRRTLEGFAPGSTDWKTGVVLGLGVMAASGMRMPGSGKRISEHLVEKLGAKRLGLTQGKLGIAPDELLSTRDMFWQGLERDSNPIGRGSEKWRTMSGRRDIYSALKEKLGGHSQASARMNDSWRAAEDQHRNMMRDSFKGGVNKDLLGSLDRVRAKYNNGNWFQRNIAMQAEGFATQAYHSFFGANAAYDKTMRAEVSKLGFQGMTPVGRLGRLATLGVAAFGAHQLLTGAALGSMESSEELSDIYAGRKDVEVKKSRGWESGSQPYGGGETSYFRPHQIALMLNRTREKGIWGADEDEISPISKFLRKNFTYELEERNYYDRPYPITGAFGQDIPIIGGLVASTVGRLIKPAKLMHPEEWAREGADGNTEFKSIYKGSRQEPAYALGAQGPGTPVSPFGVGEQFKFMSFQSRQLSGFCFPGHSMVTTENGFSRIDEISEGAKVFSLDGKYHAVTDVFKIDEHDSQLVTLHTAGWRENITCTLGHRIPVCDISTGSVLDKPAQDILPGDYLIVPVNRYNNAPAVIDLADNVAALSTDKWIYNSKILQLTVDAIEAYFDNDLSYRECLDRFSRGALFTLRNHTPTEGKLIRRVPRNIQLTKELLHFFGWYVAEGNADFTRIQFTLARHEDAVADFLENTGRSIGCVVNKRCSPNEGSLVVRMSHPTLWTWLKKEFGHLAKNKHIPSWVKDLAPEYLCQFMSGLLQGDGYCTVDKKIGGFKSCSARLVQDTAECLLKLNIKTSFNLNVQSTDNGFMPGTTSCRNQFVSSSLEVLKSQIEKYIEVYWNRWDDILLVQDTVQIRGSRIHNGNLLIKVKSVECVVYDGPLYDLTIEDLHYYVVEQVAVHNTGWLRNTLQGAITGDNNFAHNQPVLANAGDMSSPSRMFWEANVGGAFFASELWRRVLPRKQAGIDTVNPIRNSMPSWMPDKFHTGDKFAELEWGEARLPGAGYAANHRELMGVDPEEYPILARMAILGDVAPTSVEYRRIQEQVYQKRQQGGFTPEQEAFIDQKDAQVAQQVNQYSFDRQDARAIRLPGSGLTQAAWSGGLSALRHAAAPIEYLTPMGFRPTQKLLSDYRDPIESYEQERLYGTQLAFWDKPMRDWFRPAAYSAAHMMGFDGKPQWRREADAVGQRFDEIEFHKWMKLAMAAEAAGDTKTKNQYMWAASNTRTGINPQGSAMSIYWSLPESERSYFNSFSMAQGNERERILEMVPRDQAHLYQAIWSRIDQGDQSVVSGEGLGIDENFLKAKFYQQPTTDMPSEDFLGWHSEIDISDVKVRYAEKYASDIADYGIWESQVKKSESQDFLDGSESYIGSPGTIAASQIRSRLWNMSGSALNRPSVSVFGSTGGTRVRMNYNDHRDTDMATAYQKALTGGY